MCSANPLFHFPHVPQNRFRVFVAHGENEYRQKAFRSHAGKCCCRYPGGFQRRAGEACLWHTILLARSSMLYLLFREAGKGVMSPYRTAHLYSPKTAAKNCEGMSRVWLLFSRRKRGQNAMKPALPAEQEVYKSSRLTSRRSAVSQKDAFKMQACFRFVCSVCFQNESVFSCFANPPIG